MSIFGKVAGFFEGAVSSVIGAAKDAWGAIETVWALLVQTASVLTEAWNWVVNGVNYFTEQVESWAAQVFNGLKHVLFTVIPNAIIWAIKQAVGWAARAVRDVANWAKTAVSNAIKWAKSELAKVEALARRLVSQVIRWVTGPINWVIHTGIKIANLVLHPEALVKWIIGSLVVPLILWLLRSSIPVLTWLVRTFLSRAHEAESILEDFIAKVI
jgi:hypothetical protein